jgi:hypothetical protein
MKVKTIVTSYAGGVKQVVVESAVIEATREEYESAVGQMKEYISTTPYFELDGVIVPGDFLRSSCTIAVVEVLE